MHARVWMCTACIGGRWRRGAHVHGFEMHQSLDLLHPLTTLSELAAQRRGARTLVLELCLTPAERLTDDLRE